MLDIQLSYYIFDKCREFANKRIVDSEKQYRYRGENSKDKMLEDIMIGCMAEFAVYQYLKELGHDCTKPDLTIYKARKKSYSADLIASGYNVHVKSQSLKSIEKYGRSWLFQRTDSLVSAPDEVDIIATASVDVKCRKVTLLGFISPISVCKASKWGECRVDWYRKTKVALYLEDLEKAGLVLSKF